MIFDVEADGLLRQATKIHVLAYEKSGKVFHTHDYDEMRKILLSAKVLIGHNIIRYDIPLLEKILGIKIKARLIDTLSLSWYLNHSRNIHGLDSYGKEFGVPKPVVDDWENLTPEEYAHRCREDVKINSLLWKQLRTKLLNLYEDKKNADRLISYLSFKLKCAAMQEESRWKLDRELAETSLQTLYEQEAVLLDVLIKAMPPVKKYVVKTRPAKPFKKDGTYSVIGAKWFMLLKERGLSEDYNGPVEIFSHEEAPNPGSHPQIKDWLFSLGWKPITFKYEKDDDGVERKIPQVRIEGDDGKELCPSVKKLIDKEPAIDALSNLTVIQHRISIFKGFLENVDQEGFLTAEINGLTNTLRFKHKVLVNLPKVTKPWGEQVRGCLVARDGMVLCGSDMTSLEETTKKHFMFPMDPEFVEEMSRAGFDPHLDLAKHAGAVTQEEIDTFIALKKQAQHSPEEQKLYLKINLIRGAYKAANYACIYGVGKAKLARETGLTVIEAAKLIDTYWQRNWSVKKLVDDLEKTNVKVIKGEMWLFNPVSRLWYSLRYTKDIFSTLNQGTGVWCFDNWIREILSVRPQLTGQFHDEIIIEIKKGAEDKCKKLLKDAIERVNNKLKLNLKLDVDVQFGFRYSEVH